MLFVCHPKILRKHFYIVFEFLSGVKTAPRPRAGGILLGILGEGVPPCSPNPDPISDQKVLFSAPVFRPDLQNPYPFSDLTFRQKLCYHYLDWSKNKQILQIHFEFAYFSFFLEVIWN